MPRHCHCDSDSDNEDSLRAMDSIQAINQQISTGQPGPIDLGSMIPYSNS
jgi:hypothetical protein